MPNWHKFDRADGAVWINFDNAACIKVIANSTGGPYMTEIFFGSGSVQVHEDIVAVMKLARGNDATRP